MKLKGIPNRLISMDMSVSVRCDDEGIIDLDKTLDYILNKILIPRLTPKYPVIEEESGGIKKEKIDTTEKVYTCKTCGEEIQGMGKYLAHCRTHKKEGDS